MKNIFKMLAASVFAVVGCAPMDVAVKKPIENKKIGISYDLGGDSMLCHRHTGFTAFQNFEKPYKVNDRLEKAIIRGYEEGIKSSGNIAIIASDAPYILDELSVDAWASKVTATDSAKLKLMDYGKKKNIDYLLVSVYSKFPNQSNECQGVGLYTGGNNYGIPMIPLVSAYLFDLSTGEKVGTVRIRNGALKVLEPKNVDELTSDEINYYIKMNGEYAEKSVLDFIGVTKGNPSYYRLISH